MVKQIGWILLLIWLVGAACALRDNAAVKSEILAINEIIDISALKPEISKLPLWAPNAMAMDRHGNIYILDMPAHRIMKYDSKGLFLAQIGSIGQEIKNLFDPWGISIEDELIYILNNGGKEIKIFSLNGEYRSSFNIENAWFSNSICTHQGLIYVNVLQKAIPNENADGLIHVYAKDGRLMRKIGQIIKCNSLAGYSTFNQILMATTENDLYWAFISIPAIHYRGIEGSRKESDIDLLSLGISEIVERAETAKKEGFDSPETSKSDADLSIKSMGFCNGFVVDVQKKIYYAFRTFPNRQYQTRLGSNIYVFSDKGKLEKIVIPRYAGETIMMSHLLLGPNDSRYGVGIIKGKTVLFKF